jgi:hypothetical protein
MAFAYLDKYSVLHVVENMQIAVNATSGKVVETSIEHEGGYPVVDGEVVIYEEGKAFINGNIKSGKEIPVPGKIAELVESLK